MSSLPRPLIALLGLVTLLLAPTAPATAVVLPSGFQQSVAFSGLMQPTAVQFASDGRVFVAEKSGLIQVFDSLSDPTPTIFADLRTNTHNFWDRGLLGLTLHPNFPATPYVYVLYTLDAAIGGTPPRWGSFGGTSDSCPNPPGDTVDGCVVAGRVSRLTAVGNVMVGTEQVFIENFCQQYPSHSIGTIGFGGDGALYVSGGDGASFNFVDYGQKGYPQKNPCDDPPNGVGGPTQAPPSAEGGALRSQDLLSSGDPVTFDGTVLRLDPISGAPMADNPLVGGTTAADDPIIAYGLRNPFRMAARPGTSEMWVGDVGWNDWEEIDRVGHTGDMPIENFGWPCYEGIGKQAGYQGAGLALCQGLYGAPGTVTDPFFTYKHSDKVVPDEACGSGSSAVSGLAFYQNGAYPTRYEGALFLADYSRSCIWAMPLGPDGDPDPSARLTFASAASAPVDLKIGPGGDLFYVDITGGRIFRVSYVAGTEPPVAVIDVDKTDGPTPLVVQFDGSGSSDPDPGDALAYSWDLDGNGTFGDSTAVAPTATYSTAGTYKPKLRVTDPHGATATASITITAGNSHPTATIITPLGTTTWHAGSILGFSGSATDPQQGTLGSSALTWTLVLHHCPANCHEHTIQTFTGATGSFTAPEHEYPTHLELRLTATDGGGLTDTTSVFLYPETVDLTVASDPPGLSLTVGSGAGATPFVRTEIVGSAVSLGAPTPQTLNGYTYTFVSWSDGGAQSHEITTPTTATSYVALFATTCATCDDGDICTADTCDPQNGCTHSATPGCCTTDAQCDDGDWCTGIETCDGETRTCHAGVPQACVSTPTPTPTLSPTRTASPTPTSTSTPTRTATATRTPTPTPTQTASPTPTRTASPTPTRTVTRTRTPTPTVTRTATPTRTASPTRTATPTGGTRTPTPTRTATATPTLSSTATVTGTPTPTVITTLTGTPTASATPTLTATASATTTATPTATPTLTAAPTASATPSATTTPVPTTTATITVTPTETTVPTSTATLTASATTTSTPTLVATATPTITPASTTTPAAPTITATATALPTTTATPPAVTTTPTPAPITGGCDGAIAIPSEGGTFTGTTTGAGTLAGSCAASGSAPERVFAWTPSVSGAATIQTCNGAATSYDSVVYVRAADCASGAEIACNDDAAGCFTNEPNDHHASRLTTSVLAGQIYFIVVDGYATSRGDFSLTVTPPNASAPSPTPTLVPSACQNPTILPAEGGTFTGTTVGTSSLASQCADTVNAPEQVFQWTPSASGTATIQTCNGAGTAYDTVLYLRHADCTGGSDLACNDDAPGCFTSEPNDHHGSRITPNVVAGETYFIVVDGYGGSRGAFSLAVNPPATGPPSTPVATLTATAAPATPTAPGPLPTPTSAPGSCTAPIILPAAGGSFSGTTSGTSALAGGCALSANAPEIVFSWTPATSGLATIGTCGSGTSYDTVVYVRNGSCSGSEATCNDDTSGCTTGEPSLYHGSQVSMLVVAGETYVIVVDGYDTRSGTFSLSLTPPL